VIPAATEGDRYGTIAQSRRRHGGDCPGRRGQRGQGASLAVAASVVTARAAAAAPLNAGNVVPPVAREVEAGTPVHWHRHCWPVHRWVWTYWGWRYRCVGPRCAPHYSYYPYYRYYW